MVKWLGIISIALLVFAAVACGAKGPNPVVVESGKREGAPPPALAYKIWVDCTIRNDGGAGEIDAFAEIRSDLGGFREEKTVTLDKGVQTDVTFEFTGARMHSIGLRGWRHKCGFENR